MEDAEALPFEESRALLSSGNAFSRGSCADAARICAHEAHRQGLVSFIDLDLRPTEWPSPDLYGSTLRPVLELVDVVIGTEEELAAALTSNPDSVKGVTVTTAEGRADVPGFEVKGVNTVGAGDAFAAGLIWARLEGWDWTRSTRFANACSAIEVTRHECSIAFPTGDEVVAFVDERGGF